MTKKWGLISVLGFGMYVVAMYFYFFHSQDSGIPATLKGTVVDPNSFMSAQELVLSKDLAKIRNFLFFIATPFEWFLYFIILISGISHLFEKWSPVQKKWAIWRNAVYLFLLSILVFILKFPLDYYQYSLSKSYGISTQLFSSWMRDNVIDFWMEFGMLVIIVTVLYWLIKKSTKRWWLYAWALTVPFSIFLMFIQPVVIDPIYNDFYPLKDKELETKILSLAEQADIPSEHVYEVNMAEKTNALNAYVTGIGANSRIVLWDTTLNRLTDEEILFIMAHEMGHYVMKDIYIGIAGYLLTTLIGLWLIAKIMPWMILRYGSLLKIKKMSNINSLPLFLLISSFLLFFSSPLSNMVSRYQEQRADQYAMELVEDPEAAVSAFQQLTKAGLGEVNPSTLVKWFRYSHPPMIERIKKVADQTKRE
ncbi:peptidase M48 [Lysinibacillus sp. 2017]|uniref:M48 family metallopeptidase n=1 Tax=unclassified Lysinibacillus TaxID=2636778 RepID=UPI000D525C2A|nr:MULTISPECIES: M48 family metallopeptidase [unclassified Lysinibacillus]AWE06958.1 peptidase M48 [Lysinibacillus sp. 2017]TGN37117.1 M48 family peptidase [Lysinibacillus sp. S2017]